MQTEPCGYDDCQRPGECDGRRCLEAPGTVRLSPKEIDQREREERHARALALLDRVGDAAADALMKGEAVVVPWPVTVEMVRASNPADDAQDLLAHFTLHEGIAAGRLDRGGE
jgi:hypothetical protein